MLTLLFKFKINYYHLWTFHSYWFVNGLLLFFIVLNIIYNQEPVFITCSNNEQVDYGLNSIYKPLVLFSENWTDLDSLPWIGVAGEPALDMDQSVPRDVSMPTTPQDWPKTGNSKDQIFSVPPTHSHSDVLTGTNLDVPFLPEGTSRKADSNEMPQPIANSTEADKPSSKPIKANDSFIDFDLNSPVELEEKAQKDVKGKSFLSVSP